MMLVIIAAANFASENFKPKHCNTSSPPFIIHNKTKTITTHTSQLFYEVIQENNI